MSSRVPPGPAPDGPEQHPRAGGDRQAGVGHGPGPGRRSPAGSVAGGGPDERAERADVTPGGPDPDPGFLADGDISASEVIAASDALVASDAASAAAAAGGAGGAAAPPPGDAGRSVRAVVGRAALIIVAATLIGRILGLVRDIAVAYFFGAQADTDAFFLAYRIPYLLTLMVAGALTATFVPLFSYRLAKGRRQEAWNLSVNVGNVIGVILIAVTVILIVLAPWIIPLVGFGFDAATAGRAVFLFPVHQ